MDPVEWGKKNNCKTFPAYNESRTELICYCPDDSLCHEKDNVRTGCPCSGTASTGMDASVIAGIVVGGVVFLVCIGYLVYYYSTRTTPQESFVSGVQSCTYTQMFWDPITRARICGK